MADQEEKIVPEKEEAVKAEKAKWKLFGKETHIDIKEAEVLLNDEKL